MMEMFMFLMYLMFILIKNNNIYIISMLIYIYVFLLFFKLNLMNYSWWNLNGEFAYNIYNFMLVILSLWILSLIMLNLNNINNFKKCNITLILMFMVIIFNFLTLNLVIFYLLFETSLLLIYFLILNWSASKFKILASYLLFFYTLFFSLPMLIILLLMKMEYYTLNFLLLEYNHFKLSINMNMMIFLLMLLSFMVKIPMFIIHYWLLKAHVEAPFVGSMILASIVLKLGTYGLLRINLIFSNMMMNISECVISLSMIGTLLLSMSCIQQSDMKMLVAMSSVVHMNLLISSLFTGSILGMAGSYMIMLAHGLTSSGLFYLINMIYEQTKSRIMILNKGMMLFMPSMSLMWFLLCSSNMSAPISLNLVSEIFMLSSLIMWNKFILLMLFLYCLMSFIYSIYLYSYIQHGLMENFNYFFSNCKLLNYHTLLMHWIPINILFLNLIFL